MEASFTPPPSPIALFALFSCCLASLPVYVKKKEKLQNGYGHLSVRQIMYRYFLKLQKTYWKGNK